MRSSIKPGLNPISPAVGAKPRLVRLSRFSVSTSKFQPIFDWLNDQEVEHAEIWASDGTQKVALIAAASLSADHAVGWSPWVEALLGTPHQILDCFQELEIQVERRVGFKLWAQFPWAVTTLSDYPELPTR